MTQAEVIQLMKEDKLTITDVIDAFIEANAIIGVGLITLGEDLSNYVTNRLGNNIIEGDN